VDNAQIFRKILTMRNGHKHIKVRFGLAIRHLRLRRNLTQEELAHQALLHRTYLTDIERGTRNPSIEVVEKLANGLGISVSELFRLAETVTPSPRLVSRRKNVS
jgi:transcriptional regulator with XRE-family HTH domain